MNEPQTIDVMIEEIGDPQNYAEQVLLSRMGACVVAERAATTETRKFGEWMKALTIKHCILAYRTYGDLPILEVSR